MLPLELSYIIFSYLDRNHLLLLSHVNRCYFHVIDHYFTYWAWFLVKHDPYFIQSTVEEVSHHLRHARVVFDLREKPIRRGWGCNSALRFARLRMARAEKRQQMEQYSARVQSFTGVPKFLSSDKMKIIGLQRFCDNVAYHLDKDNVEQDVIDNRIPTLSYWHWSLDDDKVVFDSSTVMVTTCLKWTSGQ